MKDYGGGVSYLNLNVHNFTIHSISNSFKEDTD